MLPITTDSCRQVLSQDETSDVVYWPVLRWANEQLLRRVHQFFLVGHDKQGALIFTQDHFCYALGEFFDTLIGSEQVGQHEIRALRGKQVTQCSSGSNHFVILVQNGDLYGWGNSGHLARVQMMITPLWMMDDIQMVACGKSHTVALHTDGTLWSWGDCFDSDLIGFFIRQNQPNKRSKVNNNSNQPIQVISSWEKQRVVQIGCINNESIALTDHSRVYRWNTQHTSRLEEPTEVQLPHSFTIASISIGINSFVILNEDGTVHQCFFENRTLITTPINFEEPVQAMLDDGTSFTCVKLESGRVAIFSSIKEKIIHTSLTSMADTFALYAIPNSSFRHLLGLINLPPHALRHLSQISYFHDPSTSDFTLSIEKESIYFNKEIALQRSPYFAILFENEMFQNYYDYPFVIYFSLAQFLHTGTIGVIEPQWAFQLLKLALESDSPGLKDLCLHFIIGHMPEEAQQKLCDWHWFHQIWPSLGKNPSLTSIGFYCQLDRDQSNSIYQLMATQALGIAHKICTSLGVPCDQLPQQYLRDMSEHYEEQSIVYLLQDSSTSGIVSRYLANTLTPDNCFDHFRLAVELRNEFLQEEVARFVAEFDDHLFLYGTSGFKNASSQLIKLLFVNAFKKLKVRNVFRIRIQSTPAQFHDDATNHHRFVSSSVIPRRNKRRGLLASVTMGQAAVVAPSASILSGHSTEGALVFTRDHFCYALGEYFDTLLGVSHQPEEGHREICALRGKPIAQCSSGLNHLMILAQNGDLYGWDHVGGVQMTTPLVMMNDVQMVASGMRHIVALHTDGTVWVWGDRFQPYLVSLNVQQNKPTKKNQPTQVVASWGEQRVVQIGCIENESIVLTDHSRVYRWEVLQTGCLEKPTEVRLPHSFKIASISIGIHHFVILNEDGTVHRCYPGYSRYMIRPINLEEPVQAMLYDGTSFICVKLESGRVAIVNSLSIKIIHTSLTSIADAFTLYAIPNSSFRHLLGLINLPPHALRNLSQISYFHDPSTSDFTLRIEKESIYFNKEIALQRSSYFVILFENEMFRNHYDYPFVVYFSFAQFLHTGTIGAIEPQWAFQLLELALESHNTGLKDLCLHFINSHMPEEAQQLCDSQWFPKIWPSLGKNPGLTHTGFYCQLDQNKLNAIFQLMATQALGTAHRICTELLGAPCDQLAQLPQQYQRDMSEHYEEQSIVYLLQDSSTSDIVSRYLVNTLTSDNCFDHFRLALKSGNEFLQEEVARFVAELDDHLFLCGTSSFENADSKLVKLLFVNAFKLRSLTSSTDNPNID